MPASAVPLSRWFVFWGVALGGAAFDLITKHVVFSRMRLGQIKPIIDGILELHLTHNKGALWGFGSWLPHSGLMFAVLSMIAGGTILYWLFARGAASDLWLTVALGLIMAGAIGNCYDRLRYGHVRDFVHFHVDSIHVESAIFNFADNMLILGAVGLVVLAFRPERRATDGTGTDATGARRAEDLAAAIPGVNGGGTSASSKSPSD